MILSAENVNPMWSIDPAKPICRVLFVIVGVILLARGTTALRTPFLSYRNLSGDLVFGPFVIVFGLMFILGALFKPNPNGRLSSAGGA